MGHWQAHTHTRTKARTHTGIQAHTGPTHPFLFSAESRCVYSYRHIL